MPERLDDVDFLILATLRETQSRLDPVPVDLVDRIKFALTVRALDAEIAELTTMALLPTRDDTAMADTVTFTAGSLSLMVTITAGAGETSRIDGWVTAPRAKIEVSVDDWATELVADAHGRISVEGVPHGRVQFVIWPDPASPAATPVVTPGITI